MKHLYNKIIFVFLMASVGFGLPSFAQLRADRAIVNLGELALYQESSEKVKLTNSTPNAVTITNILTCGGMFSAVCDKTVIPAGGEASLTIKNTADLVGRFAKIVLIHTDNQSKPLQIQVKGRVKYNIMVSDGISSNQEYEDYQSDETDGDESAFVREEVLVELESDVNYGKLKLSTDKIFYDKIYTNETATRTIYVQNLSDTISQPTLQHCPDYLIASTEPETISPGEACRIDVTLDASKLPATPDIIKDNVKLAFNPTDLTTEAILIPISIVSLGEKPANITAANKAPKIEVSDNEVNFSVPRNSKGKYVVKIMNKGTEPLHITKLHSFTSDVNATVSSAVIKPGKFAKLTILFLNDLPDFMQSADEDRKILLLTNDPANPDVFIKIKNNK